MNNYWEKIKKDFQYKLKEILDKTIHLKYLQAILREFDSVIAPNEDVLI